MNFNLYFIFLVNLTLVVGVKRSYEGYKVYKTVPKTQQQLDDLVLLRENGIAEFWDDNIVINQDSRITVSSEKESEFLERLNKSELNVELLIDDLQRVINEQLNSTRRSVDSSAFLSLDWDNYHSLEEIYSWLDELAATYPDIVKVVVMGRSVENREIKGIIIDYKKTTYPPRGMLEGTCHAREWISAATVTWIIKEFLTSTDPEVRFLAENFEWHIFPVVNPDGYSYSFTDNRMWRKNRSTANFTSCSTGDDNSNGVDLNRNFDFVWMSTGASNDPCSNTFAGPQPFSEPESQAIAQYVSHLQKDRHNLIYYIAFHSYSQLVVVPYSHVSGPGVLTASNYGDMYEIGVRGADKLRERFGTNYRVGVSADVMYEMSGTSFDWVKHEAEVPVTYLIEMRDMGVYGFLLPADQIIPNSREIMEFILEMDRVTRRMEYYHIPFSSATYFVSNTIFITAIVLFVMISTLNCNLLLIQHVAKDMDIKILVIFVGIFCSTNAAKSYEHFKVYNVVPKTDVQVQYLTDLRKENYDFWTDIIEIDSNVRIMVSPEQADELVQYSKSVGMDIQLSIHNVQELIDAQMKPAIGTRSTSLGSLSWDEYYTLEEIYKWLDELEELYPNIVRTVTIGSTYEGRQIKGIVLDLKAGERPGGPLTGVIEGGIHAREWISPATVTYIIKEFLTSEEPAIRNLAETFVWHIIPVTNPDGYDYTFTGNRMWRKNRNPDNYVPCTGNSDLGNGIDLNRNFDFVWMSVGASNNSCSETYAGPTASSELEARALSNYVLGIKNNGHGEVIYYFAFHSFSQMILVPYSHVTGTGVLDAKNYGDMYEIAIRGADKLKERYGTQYTVGVSAEILYAVSGSSFDFMKGVVDIPIVYLFELRDVGQYGFLLPPSQIIPNGEEIMDCLIEMDRVTRLLGYYHYPSSSITVYGSAISVFTLLIILMIF
ncbi:uncharacterized protein LOC113520958 [Galleria mellonella]|uniref:Uncharacterized protein LOC113520958 n=1 Tax=Galleria mellonella TaxID=7137 RepID=A0ABM3MZE0_GALME|nr:uncharacterized protein LOC113520958 [Galleria mellonella]